MPPQWGLLGTLGVTLLHHDHGDTPEGEGGTHPLLGDHIPLSVLKAGCSVLSQSLMASSCVPEDSSPVGTAGGHCAVTPPHPASSHLH